MSNPIINPRLTTPLPISDPNAINGTEVTLVAVENGEIISTMSFKAPDTTSLLVSVNVWKSKFGPNIKFEKR